HLRVEPLGCPTFSHPQDTGDTYQNQNNSQGFLHIVAMFVVFKRLIADVAGGMPELARTINSAARRLGSGRLPFNKCCIASTAAAPSRYLGCRNVVNGTRKCSLIRIFPNPATEISLGISSPCLNSVS